MTMASRSKEVEKVKTTNLTLAVFLKMSGQKAELTMDEGRTGTWTFPATPALEALSNDFHQGHARVEPRAFHHAMAAERRELFAMLDAD